MTPRISNNAPFAEWLEKNQARLSTPLRLHRRHKNGAHEYRFPEAKALRVVAWDGSICVNVLHKRKVFDRLLDLDLAVQCGADGRYFCQWCEEEGHIARYPDRASLLEGHTFEPFLEWCKEILREDRVLVLEFVPGQWSSACFRESGQSVEPGAWGGS
ncbi:MAG: hypothetical protein MUC50_20580 [Myxococcota bacterium]|jgi:hypothetical protein|nr:hypothetical protein [Myxococcota bacterium]